MLKGIVGGRGIERGGGVVWGDGGSPFMQSYLGKGLTLIEKGPFVDRPASRRENNGLFQSTMPPDSTVEEQGNKKQKLQKWLDQNQYTRWVQGSQYTRWVQGEPVHDRGAST